MAIFNILNSDSVKKKPADLLTQLLLCKQLTDYNTSSRCIM